MDITLKRKATDLMSAKIFLSHQHSLNIFLEWG